MNQLRLFVQIAHPVGNLRGPIEEGGREDGGTASHDGVKGSPVGKLHNESGQLAHRLTRLPQAVERDDIAVTQLL